VSAQTDVIAEVIGVTDDGQLVEIYVEAERFHRPVLRIVLLVTLPLAVAALGWALP
jgi:hypothetical protein